jgi:ABC-type bacteriocin/lantibiotic exporter with double-glycine peptidase domain
MITLTKTRHWAGSLLLGMCVIAIVAVSCMHAGLQHLLAYSLGAEYLGAEGVVIQTTGNNCGSAALKMVCDHYRIVSSLHEIDSAVTVTRHGASMLALKTFAESKHLQAEGWKLTYDEFERRQFPMIIFINGIHFVIADSTRAGHVFLRDPSIGRLKMTRRNLLKIWKGEALIFSCQH